MRLTFGIYVGKWFPTPGYEYKNKGRYNLEFDGSELTSGIYIYRITAGEFSASRKLVLMKGYLNSINSP
ncbi:MAG: T9SS type A sorting domain-containing protein [Melioribacteraceae bacterium]|nr:T9SS type A sorting domain-containing protein [Melioribacteraceae bacterium]MCF8356985.1 T9SS type A sorting domain-containing protein [Melioribacteraceae bacterium]MCF8396450.1 T9SS type A sorting domain-containing protein [Melioribacteraceae bacterium]MCF8421195.1 T9SS type A sorting domain-containing protein [Melioribacteraceae bacterium]